MLTLVKWKTHQSLIQPKTHYFGIKNTNWEVQIVEGDSPGYYHTQVTDGYRVLRCKFNHQKNTLKDAKIEAMKMLSETYKYYTKK